MATVLITGTSSGIGLATALDLARAGHKVYATMRNPAGAPELGERASRKDCRYRFSRWMWIAISPSRIALQQSSSRTRRSTFS